MDIEIYTLPTCPFCIKAKEKLRDNYLDYQEFDISHDEENIRKELATKFNLGVESATVPQIVINGQHIGGYTDLKELIDKGSLSKFKH